MKSSSSHQADAMDDAVFKVPSITDWVLRQRLTSTAIRLCLVRIIILTVLV
jgi:hypothetical protein